MITVGDRFIFNTAKEYILLAVPEEGELEYTAFDVNDKKIIKSWLIGSFKNNFEVIERGIDIKAILTLYATNDSLNSRIGMKRERN